MYDHHIVNMANDVIAAGLVSPEKKEDLITALKKEWRDKIAPSWSAEDVIYRAEENGVTLTEEEAIEILYRVDRRWDANVGISWDIFDIFIDDVVEERNAKSL